MQGKTKFVNPNKIVAQLDLKKGSTVADLGSGSGYYTVAMASAVGEAGVVYAVDILRDKLEVTESNAQLEGMKNVELVQADLEKPLKEIPHGSCDVVIMCNIVHQVSNKSALLGNAYRILKTGGKLLVVDWKKDMSPFGPLVSDRVSEEEIEKVSVDHGFKPHGEIQADGYHYALVFLK